MDGHSPGTPRPCGPWKRSMARLKKNQGRLLLGALMFIIAGLCAPEILPQQLPPPHLPPPPASASVGEAALEQTELVDYPVDPPPGFAGPTSILPRDEQVDPHFVPVEDRWRIGMPDY